MACVGSEVVVAVVAVDVEDQLDVDVVCSSCSVDCERTERYHMMYKKGTHIVVF